MRDRYKSYKGYKVKLLNRSLSKQTNQKNSKSEFRNPKQIQNPKRKWSKQPRYYAHALLDFGNYSLVLASDFDFRHSNFLMLILAAVYGAGFCRSRAPRSCASRSCNWHKVFLLMVLLS